MSGTSSFLWYEVSNEVVVKYVYAELSVKGPEQVIPGEQNEFLLVLHGCKIS